MSQPTCELCSRPMPDTAAYVCDSDATKLGEDLRRVVDLAPEVEVAIAKLVRLGRGVGSSGWKQRPLPVDLAAAQRAAAIGNTVATWARHVSESRGKPVPRLPVKPLTLGPLCYHGTALPSLLDSLSLLPCPHASCEAIRPPRPDLGVAAAARFLADPDNLRWLRHRREAKDAFTELTGAARDLERLVGRPRDLWYAGACWAELPDGGRCPNELYVAPGTRVIVCRSCDAEYDAEGRREWLLAEAYDALVHAELMARALTALGVQDLTAARVRGMARHGRLADHGTDPAGRPLYKVGEVLAVIDEQVLIEEGRKRRREAKAAKAEARKQAAEETAA